MNLLMIGALALSLIGANAPIGNAPATGAYLFMGEDVNDSGEKVFSYASEPQERSGDTVTAWYLDVFAKPMRWSGGEAVYAAALYRFDCATGLSRLEGAVLYDGLGKVLGTVGGDDDYGDFTKGSIGDRMEAANCARTPTTYPLKGIPALLSDAAGRNPDAAV